MCNGQRISKLTTGSSRTPGVLKKSKSFGRFYTNSTCLNVPLFGLRDHSADIELYLYVLAYLVDKNSF
jgi:hypothetical protein